MFDEDPVQVCMTGIDRNITIDIQPDRTGLELHEPLQRLGQDRIGDRPPTLIQNILFGDRNQNNAGISPLRPSTGLDQPIVDREFKRLKD